MKNLVLAAVACAGAVALAKPEVTDVVIAQDGAKGLVRVSYQLSEPAVVLVDILTNGVSVGGAALRNLKGDAGRLVAAGARSVSWKPSRSGMPQMSDPNLVVTATVEAWSRHSPPDYLVVDLSQPSNFTYYASADRIPGGVGSVENKTKRMVFRKIPAAGETMILGSGAKEVPTAFHTATNDYVNPPSAYIRSCDQLSHPVGFTNDFYLAIYECTQGQWLQVFGKNKSPWGDTGCRYTDCPDSALRPVTGRRYSDLRGIWKEGGAVYNWPVDGHAVAAGCDLDDFRNLTGLLFDLPTVANWEFAARAGVTTITPSGNAFLSLSNVTDYAWCAENWRDDPMSVSCGNANQTHAVGQKLPNAWGLYDMLGNASECCLDVMDWDDKGALLDPLKGAYSIDYPGPTDLSSTQMSRPRRVRVGGYYEEAFDRMRFSRRATMAATMGGDATYRAWLPAESPAWQIGE